MGKNIQEKSRHATTANKTSLNLLRHSHIPHVFYWFTRTVWYSLGEWKFLSFLQFQLCLMRYCRLCLWHLIICNCKDFLTSGRFRFRHFPGKLPTGLFTKSIHDPRGSTLWFSLTCRIRKNKKKNLIMMHKWQILIILGLVSEHVRAYA